ncbi:E3 ubiquitin-protein ligase TRIM39-like [Chanos chanos]|uniref:E3 ubiquitin-protein ligase TRIM39-like n=1 Tax=Chanos chanos TaxID=29144 RepID=A0A6J2VTN9_CHACN|nr:E3 ubiquitin-protein ligase TRIM39-like [Chanos chanos]
MASCRSFLPEEQLQCSICLDVFTDPVTIACGHNFCKLCITQHWSSAGRCLCPLCNYFFHRRPKLRVNTMIRELVNQLKTSNGVTASFAKPDEVPCDICEGQKLRAVKTCLVCVTSYCDTHLNPHRTAQTLKRHKLVDPVVNLESYICKKHNRMTELFCTTDQTCVCPFCMTTDHENHSVVTLEEGITRQKTQLEKTQVDLKKMIQHRLGKIEDVKQSVEVGKKEKADSIEILAALIRSMEKSQAELVEVMEEKQETAEKQAEAFIKELEQEIAELRRTDAELEQLSNTKDDRRLLQIPPSLWCPPNVTNLANINIDTQMYVESLRRAKSQMEELFYKAVEMIPEIKLKRNQVQEVDVTLDPNTAHPNLIISSDGKQVACGDSKRDFPDNPERFDRSPCILAKEGFLFGRFYYEVQVSGKTDWDVGVARESINRKGKITAVPENGYWTVRLRNEKEYWANDSPRVSVFLRQKPQKVGVFVDYEGGVVSFYDVEAKCLIYTFTGVEFIEKLYPYFSLGLSHGGKNSAPLIILPTKAKGYFPWNWFF